ncbi:MAG TPA: type II secretion system protein [Candidatus Polarisedimenticolia bacterium]|nr:type II secretion system protein [Candidatus Polarisedimenticolia bacterium]
MTKAPAACRLEVRARKRRAAAGFTLIELLIVVAIIGILATMAVVQLKNTPQRAKEAALKENLYVLRNVIDQYFTDKGKYPDSLQTLVDDGYIRKIPVDPMTESDNTWVEEQAPGSEQGADADTGGDSGGVGDVHSGSDATALDGSSYSEW